jgi:hemolysin III
MTDVSARPALRGVFHQIAFFAALVAGAALIAIADARFRLPVTVYVLALVLQLGTSAIYHRVTWSPRARAWWRRGDHATIFLLIAGTATPVACALARPGRVRLLLVLWIGAVVGVARAIAWITAPKWLVAVIAVALGWASLPFLPALRASLDSAALALLVIGGILYSMGAAAYALRRPDPWPRTFGYHEVFHAFTIAAAVCHYVAVARCVT